MLILMRRRLEEIVIELPDGRLVVVCFVDLKNGRHARLGVVAPEDVKVHRREVYDAIQREKKSQTIRDPLNVAEAYEDSQAEGAAS